MKLTRTLSLLAALVLAPAAFAQSFPGSGSGGLTLPTTVSAGTLTTAIPMLGINGTWNNAGVTFPGALQLNVTDTASGTNSLLLDLQKGGASKFNVDKNGTVSAAGTLTGPAVTVGIGKNTGIGSVSAAGDRMDTYINGVLREHWDAIDRRMRNDQGFGWSSSDPSTSGFDLSLWRDAAGALAQQNGTNAQSFRVYNTSSSSNTNYERGVFDWQTNANVFTIGTQNGGTGVARNLEFVVGGSNKADYGVTIASAWYFVGNGGTGGFGARGANVWSVYNSSPSFPQVDLGASGITQGSGNFLAWNSATYTNSGSADTGLSRISAGVLGLGNGTAGDKSGTLDLTTLNQVKLASSSGTAPGAGFMKFEVVPGTNAGSCKLQAYAGTSTTPVTVVDNVGSGC